MNLLRWILAGLTFLAETALWLGSGRLVYLLLKGRNHSLALATGVLTVAAFLAVWGFFFAPDAAKRLADIPRALIIALLSLGIGLGLYALGMKAPGLALATAGTLILVAGQLLIVH